MGFSGISDFVRDFMGFFMVFFRRDGIFAGDDTVFFFRKRGFTGFHGIQVGFHGEFLGFLGIVLGIAI